VDPHRLESVRQRVQALRALERKYGEGEDGILTYGSEAAVRLASLQDDEGTRRDLEQRIEELAARRRALGDRITADRTGAAPRLAALLRRELHELGMPGATLEISLETLPDPSPTGEERVVFLFAAGDAQTPLPVGKVASGGELSRAMLACRSVLADLDDVPTLVFDEVDAGVGGRAAVAIARRLSTLARARQVIMVTHLAQIAARADRHFVVTKTRGAATVRPVQGDERAAELARMLSGTVGDVSLAHARELLGTGAGRV
jgi:DNA repair protein RecN (Recombination protein N)